MMTDPIADMLSRIRNAARAKKREMVVPRSRVKWEIAKILERQGFLEQVQGRGEGPHAEIAITLRYQDREPVVRNLVRISKPGRRLYVGWDGIKRVNSGYGVAILSTSQGLMTGEEAHRRHLGGEIIAEVS